MTRSFAIPLLAVFLAAAGLNLAAAGENPEIEAGPPPSNWSYMRIDQGGSASSGEETPRARLERRGITFGLSHASEMFAPLAGGLSRGRRAELLGAFMPSLTLDFSRLKVGRGEFHMSAQSLRGRGVTESQVGAAQSLSSLEERGFDKFVEAWYADSYRNGLLRIKAGQQYADAEFGVVESAADFLNSSYGLNPTTPMPTYPAPELGVTMWATPRPWISIGAGAFRGGALEPESGPAVQSGVFSIIETKIEPSGKSATWRGSYSIGFWRQSRGAWLASGGAPVRNHGIYGTADHWFRRSPSGDAAGPRAFFQWGWAPADRNSISGYAGGGVAWEGAVKARPGDAAGIGFARARLAGTGSENIIELFYKVRLPSGMSVQPDLQWVIRPAGISRNALVLGMRLGVEL